MESSAQTYREAGVDTQREELGLSHLRKWVEKTFEFRRAEGAVKLPLGFFANVIDLGHGTGLAISTDGVGTKILVAQMMGKFDTIGIDCIAMNVNDILCVGAEPLAMVDYVALESADPHFLNELAKGLYRGAEIARITIPGGELAQVKEMLRGTRPGYAFDLAGTCVGIVPLDRILVGDDLQEGDVVIGLPSSGIHSNGLTLARRVFFEQQLWTPEHFVPELGRTIGEELLEPTRIYVAEIMAMLRAGLEIKSLSHITSDGFLNLTRVTAKVGYRLDNVPKPPAIFQLIQSCGQVSDEEMFGVYNMGIGFCVVVSPKDAGRVELIAKEHGLRSHVLGTVIADPEQGVQIPAYQLVGRNGGFQPDR
jgi:phosphoribosylformylglycinamidine cyclo-ligase